MPKKAADKECCNRWRREVEDTRHGKFCVCVCNNDKQKRRRFCAIHGPEKVKRRNLGSGVAGGVEAGNQQPQTLLQPVPPQLLPLHSMHPAPCAQQAATLPPQCWALPVFACHMPLMPLRPSSSSGHAPALDPYVPHAVPRRPYCDWPATANPRQ
jgi:hypothetical protein